MQKNGCVHYVPNRNMAAHPFQIHSSKILLFRLPPSAHCIHDRPAPWSTHVSFFGTRVISRETSVLTKGVINREASGGPSVFLSAARVLSGGPGLSSGRNFPFGSNTDAFPQQSTVFKLGIFASCAVHDTVRLPRVRRILSLPSTPTHPTLNVQIHHTLDLSTQLF